MIQGFRKLFQSPVGLALTLGFVGLIALAFASADITGSSFGGIAGGERVATVGDERISTSTYRETLSGAFERARESNPQLTMKEFIDGGAAEGVLDQMSERLAIYAFARANGVRIDDALVGSELKDIPAFQGPDGQFSQQAYDSALRQRGLSEKLVRQDIEQGLAARLTLIPAQIGTRMPEKIAVQYARLLNETRVGSVALIPSGIFAEDVTVTDDTLKAYLAANRSRYSLPERRTVRYAILDERAVGEIDVTDAEIVSRYERNKATYKGTEQRILTQLVLPTEAAAQAVLDELEQPSGLTAVARDKGLSTTQITAKGQAELTSKASPAIARAAYDARQGTIAGPVRGPLGWYLLRVDSVTTKSDRSLADVRDELTQAIANEKRDRALADRAAEAEATLNDGASIAEVAKSFGADVLTTGPMLSNGSPFRGAAEPPAVVKRVIPAVFAMDAESDPQIAIAADGKSYVIYAPGTVTASAPPPFADIKPLLERDYRLQEGSKLAAAAAEKVLAAIREGKTTTEALSLVKKQMPPVDQVRLSRQQLLGSDRQVPPALALMFTMAKGSTKKLEAPQNMGWFIIDLDDIETRDIAGDDPLVVATRDQLGPQIGGELGEQLTNAILADVGITRNETAIKAVVDQLTGNR